MINVRAQVEIVDTQTIQILRQSKKPRPKKQPTMKIMPSLRHIVSVASRIIPSLVTPKATAKTGILILAILPFTVCLHAHAAEPTHVLIIVGPTDHPPGTHEVAAGGRLLQYALEHMDNVPGVKAEIVYEWPGKELRDTAATVVFMGDTFPACRLPNPKQNLADLDAMMQRGCGIVAVHYATGLLGKDVAPDGDHPLLRWLGGYFANRSCPHHESIAKIYPAANYLLRRTETGGGLEK
jgi:hypothetical protein